MCGKIEPLRKRMQVPFSFVAVVLLSLTWSLGVIEKLGMDVVPYVVLLVVPVLGRMSDQCEDVRLMATYCFATLIRFMPLEVRYTSVGNSKQAHVTSGAIVSLLSVSTTRLSSIMNGVLNKKKKVFPVFKIDERGKNRFEDKWLSHFYVSDPRISIMFRKSWGRLFSDFSALTLLAKKPLRLFSNIKGLHKL